MAKRKVSFVESGEESSRKSSERRSKLNEDEATSSRGGKELKLTSKEKELLRNEKAEGYYRKDIGNREIELGRSVDFEWLSTEDNLNVDSWFQIQGWKEFLSVNECVYPRLIRILFANLNPYKMTSCIGNISIRLDVESWCTTFNIPNIPTEAETQVRSVSRQELFNDLTGKQGQGSKGWINVNQLHKDPDMRLAALILQTALIPKKGSREQIKEEEGRLLYALKYGLDFNLAREIVDRIKQSTTRKTTPLCYGMHLMRIMRNAGVNLKCAGDSEFRELKSTSYINAKTLGRLGFKKDLTQWIAVEKGSTPTKFTAESQPQYMETEQEERRPEEGRREEAREAVGEESSMPPTTPTPKTKTTPQFQIPNLATHFQELQTAISSQIAHLTSHFSEKLDYLAATVHSKLDSMDSKIEDLSIRVKFCEAQLQPPPPPSPKPTTQAKSPSPPPPPTQHDSPLFSMEELMADVAAQPSTQADSVSHGSETASQVVKQTLKLPKRIRSKKVVARPRIKLSSQKPASP